MVCVRDPLVQQVCELHEKISKLENLSPSKDVNPLFTQLVAACTPPHPIDVTKLCTKIKHIRNNLVRLCGQAEGLLEKHYATILGSFDNPLHHLDILLQLYQPQQPGINLLNQHCSNPSRVAFVGSGPVPLTSTVLASHHLTSTVFHNYDKDASANSMALKLVESHPDLSKLIEFHMTDIMNVSGAALKDYDVVFLAALVGMERDEKMRVVEHLAKHMAPAAILMLRSADGARAFLYPVVEPRDLRGFEVLSVRHPTDDVINSLLLWLASIQNP